MAFAKFLPGLLSCNGWKIKAIIQHRRSSWQNQFQLSPADGLTSNVTPSELFDSNLEASFARKWGEQPRDGWRLYREGIVLYQNQKVFVPDFLFVHEDGRKVVMEIVGFWTPEYLEEKQKTIATFSEHRIFLAVSDSVEWPSDKQSSTTFRYKTAIKVSDVLAMLARGQSERV